MTSLLVSRLDDIIKFEYFSDIRIGFERSSYTYTEPMFEETIDRFFTSGSGPIFLTKEDGVISEQTFIVVVETSNNVPPDQPTIQPASLNEDYLLSMPTVVLQFPPFQQQLLVQITLLPDDDPEGTEAFLATSAAGDRETIGVDEFVPSYLSPTTFFAAANVIIEDDDGEWTLHSYSNKHTTGIMYSSIPQWPYALDLSRHNILWMNQLGLLKFMSGYSTRLMIRNFL